MPCGCSQVAVPHHRAAPPCRNTVPPHLIQHVPVKATEVKEARPPGGIRGYLQRDHRGGSCRVTTSAWSSRTRRVLVIEACRTPAPATTHVLRRRRTRCHTCMHAPAWLTSCGRCRWRGGPTRSRRGGCARTAAAPRRQQRPWRAPAGTCPWDRLQQRGEKASGGAQWMLCRRWPVHGGVRAVTTAALRQLAGTHQGRPRRSWSTSRSARGSPACPASLAG